MSKSKHPGGRPSVITESVLSKLEYAFSLGCSDTEACLYADIGASTLYAYQVEHPEFQERKAELKENPVLKARTTIYENLHNPNTAQWYLERKKKDEFSQKTEVDHSSLGQRINGFNYIVPNDTNTRANSEAAPGVAHP